MGREVRKVPADWQHPKDDRGRFIPLFDGADLARWAEAWDLGARKWDEYLISDHHGGWMPRSQCMEAAGCASYAEWAGERPDPSDFMPAWPDEQRTHLMMYEDVSEGTPISPAFATPEELAHWLVANEATACGKNDTASYDGWLATIRNGYAVGMVFGVDGRGVTGVEANLWFMSPPADDPSSYALDGTIRTIRSIGAVYAGSDARMADEHYLGIGTADDWLSWWKAEHRAGRA